MALCLVVYLVLGGCILCVCRQWIVQPVVAWPGFVIVPPGVNCKQLHYCAESDRPVGRSPPLRLSMEPSAQILSPECATVSTRTVGERKFYPREGHVAARCQLESEDAVAHGGV